jgi:predicted nucleic acid-binding protein
MFVLEYGCAKSKRREQSRRTLEVFLSAGFDQPPFEIEDAREAAKSALFSKRAVSQSALTRY